VQIEKQGEVLIYNLIKTVPFLFFAGPTRHRGRSHWLGMHL